MKRFSPSNILALASLTAATLFAAPVLSAAIVQTDSMSHARMQAEATTLNDGRVLITSGRDPGSASCSGALYTLPDADIFDPTTGTFSFFGSMTSPRWEHEQISLDDGMISPT